MFNYKCNNFYVRKTENNYKSILMMETIETMIDFSFLCVFIANPFFMAKYKTLPKDKENVILDYTEHMPLLRKINRNILRRGGEKERQRNSYD